MLPERKASSRDGLADSMRPIRLSPVWTFILLWPLGAFMALAAGVGLIITERQQLDPKRFDHVAEAQVTTFHYGRRSNTGSYEFLAPDPQTGLERKFHGYDVEITDADRHRAEKGRPIKVAFSAANPYDNRPVDHSLFNSIVLGGACFALCLFLVWHMARDWRRYRILVASGTNEYGWISVFWEDLNEPPPPNPFGY
jgi:hypothetical protein